MHTRKGMLKDWISSEPELEIRVVLAANTLYTFILHTLAFQSNSLSSQISTSHFPARDLNHEEERGEKFSYISQGINLAERMSKLYERAEEIESLANFGHGEKFKEDQ